MSTEQTASATGSCLCTAVQYEVSGPLRSVLYCHNTHRAIRKPGQTRGIEFTWRAIHTAGVARDCPADESTSSHQIAYAFRFSVSQRFHVDIDVIRGRAPAHGESHLQQKRLPMESNFRNGRAGVGE